MNKNRIYYGEYNLDYWIHLIVKANIELPKFQRSFVWNKDMAKELIKSLKEGQYVPPISIGEYESGNGKGNWIIDGQQRLTTILLSYLKRFPAKDAFVHNIEKLADGENENEGGEDEDIPEILEWTLRFITDISHDIGEIKLSIEKDSRYENFDNDLSDDFFKSTYLGFAYLVPDGDKVAHQKYYADVFRNININGISLQPLEARASLYFTDPTMAEIFDPSALTKYKVHAKSKTTRLDFTRYLSTSLQYIDTLNYQKVARGYRNDMEKYYRDFIYKMVSQKNESDCENTYNKILKGKFNSRINSLINSLDSLDFPVSFSSIIDIDMYFFGIIYVIILGKSVNPTDKEALTTKLKIKIEEFKNEEAHKRNPNTITRLRKRMEESQNIFKDYAR